MALPTRLVRLARGDRNVFIGGAADDRAGFGSSPRQGHGGGLDLINRGVRCVKLAGQVVETHLAAGRGESLFLKRIHAVKTFALLTGLQEVAVCGRRFAFFKEVIRGRARIRDEEFNVMETNGQVTLPSSSRSESRLTRRHLHYVLLFSALLLSLFRRRR